MTKTSHGNVSKLEPAPSKKRDASSSGHTRNSMDRSLESPPRKVAKVHPFFSKVAAGPTTSTFQWLKPSLGPKRTCLHGTHLSPQSLPKIAAFDLDGTLIKSNHHNRSNATALQWEWWRSSVPSNIHQLYQSGYSIVIVSNQALKPRQLDDWKRKVPLIAAALPDVPFRLFAATAKDGYRKPMPGIWYELERIFNDDNVKIDKSTSFFVGDAAGRPNDFASTDRKWAINVDIPFFTPEEFFLKLPSAQYSLPGFNVSALPCLPTILPPSDIIAPSNSGTELVLFTGFPCLGKSSFFRRHFAPLRYTHINQDTLGTRAKCVQSAQQSLQAGKSCVVDNTNRDVATRKYYIDVANKLKIPVRSFAFSGSIDLAWHNNLYRAYNLPPTLSDREPKRDLVPYTAFLSYRDNYEEPHGNEGFSSVTKVNWNFNGDQEERWRWGMWLQIDGK